MSDRIPGSSWSNPIWHGKWRIYVGDCPFDHPEFNYAYVHDDYDGEGDSRHGYARTVDAAKVEIDEKEAA